MRLFHSKNRITIFVSLIVLLLAMVVASGIGAATIMPKEILATLTGKAVPQSIKTILFKVRFPRIVTSVMVGGLLAVVGCLMQSVFKNKMADPSVMGISGGAALGATFTIVLGLDYSFTGIALSTHFVGAILGSLITFAFVMGVAVSAGKRGQNSVSSTLLAGIAISSLTSAIITVLMSLHMEDMERIYMWMLGSFSSSSFSKSLIILIVVIIGMPVIIFLAPQLDIIKLGSSTAATYGINANRLMWIILTISSVIVAVCVADSGVIGFIGLVVPHLVTFLGVKRMRPKVIECFIVGGILTLISDTIARCVISPSELPIGAITSLIGAPYFIILLLRNKEGK